ncbi:MAG: hypothetical protein Kow0029_11910 [Candidatus Rifleibacteriota bacterium]
MARLITTNSIKKPLTTVLIESGLIDERTLNSYIAGAEQEGSSLQDYLTQNNLLQENDVYRALADSYGLKYESEPIPLQEGQIPDRLHRVCERENLLVKLVENKKIVLYTFAPEKIRKFAPLFSALGYEPEFIISSPANFKRKTFDNSKLLHNQNLYTGISSLADSLRAEKEDEKTSNQLDISSSEELPSIVELVNKTLLLAINQAASDIHVETTESGAKIRFRIDGVLQDKFEIDKNAAQTFVSRLLVMSNLDITEKVMPQDGSFKVKCENKEVEFRIACMPGIYGQNLVLRILLGADYKELSLEALGMAQDEFNLIKATTRFPHGMILVAGPTGSGKSTTLYALLEEIADPKLKFITIEDPVERRIPGVQQIQVRVNRNEPERSLTFARGLRTILRLDPDIIMVGEIRDAETAQISVQASLTGHMVLSTVHANSSVETLRRLENIGIDFHLLMSSLNLIFSQRLLRRLCPFCKQPRDLTKIEERLLGKKCDKVFEPVGCPQCLDSGYKGRIGIFEFLPFSERLKDLISQQGLIESISQVRSERLRTLLESGLIKISEGISDFNELERVCGPCR